jgi:hypothetical protein
MSQYALVEDGQITETCNNLPHCWRNISGLDLSADDKTFLNSVGWYKIEYDMQSMEHNRETHFIEDYAFQYVDDKVICTAIVSPIVKYIPTEEVFLADVRNIRNNLLSECDWTQFPDVIEEHSSEFNTAWKNYRKELREITDSVKNLNSYEDVYVRWPIKPSVQL